MGMCDWRSNRWFVCLLCCASEMSTPSTPLRFMSLTFLISFSSDSSD